MKQKIHAMKHSRTLHKEGLTVFVFYGRAPSWCRDGSKIAWVADEEVDAHGSTRYAADGLYAVTEWDETDDPRVLMEDAVLFARVHYSQMEGVQVFKEHTDPAELFEKTSNGAAKFALELRWDDVMDPAFWLEIDGYALEAMAKLREWW